MSGTTNFTGVRVFSNLRASIARIDTRDTTAISIVMPAPLADVSALPLNTVVSISTEDDALLTKVGAGLALDTIAQIVSEGISTDILFVRTPHSTNVDPAAAMAEEISGIAGNGALKTGVHALKDAKSRLGKEPGCIIFPGYGAARSGSVANAAVVAARAVADTFIDCVTIYDTPATSKENARTSALDHATALGVIACYPNVVVDLGSGNVVRPMSAHVAAAMVRRDKEAGNPFKAFWNRPLKGVLGPSVPVGYADGDAGSEANWLNQNGIATIIEGNLLWGPFTTATDPTVAGWRSIKRIRTRRAIEKAVLRPLRQYASDDITPHTVSLIFRALDQYMGDLVTLGALIDFEVIWSKAMNPASLLEGGAMRVKTRFAETPDLTDLQIYTEPQPEAFDVLESAIAASLNQLGLNNVRVTA